MRQRAQLIISSVTAAAIFLFAAHAGHALTRDQVKNCENKGDVSADLRIAACSAVIDETREKKQKNNAKQKPKQNVKAKQKADALIERGKAYRAKGDSDSAVRDFDEAIRINPRAADAYYNRGLTLRDRGDSDRAAQDFEQTVKYDPRNLPALNTLSHLYYDKRDY